MSNKRMDIFIIGFAIFATFFGAGNLIFPPYLGVLAGQSWLPAFGGFLIGDVVLAVMAVIVSGKYKSKGIGVLSRAGEKFSVIMGCIMLACIGPLMAIPRTAATTYEISILPLTSAVNPIVFSVIFFAVTLLLTVRPSKVVDNMGKFLTPILLIALAVLIIKGFVTPLGAVRADSYITNLFAEGLAQGYQTMDAFGGTVIAIIIMASIVSKGYTDESEQKTIIVKAGIVAGICLAVVYGGLCYVGTTVSTQFGADAGQTELVVYITNALLGNGGMILLGIIIALACLTTAIGTTSAVAQFFAGVTDQKIKYEWWVIGICVFSAVISNFGVSTIIQFSGPILGVIYPVVVAMILLSIFSERINNDNVFRFAAYMALLVGILGLLGVSVVKSLPFANYGLNWFVPTAVAAVIGCFVPSRRTIKKGEVK